MNEVDSGTELESQGEEEEEVAAPENKDDGEKKDDWVVKKDYIFYSLRRAFMITHIHAAILINWE